MDVLGSRSEYLCGLIWEAEGPLIHRHCNLLKSFRKFLKVSYGHKLVGQHNNSDCLRMWAGFLRSQVKQSTFSQRITFAGSLAGMVPYIQVPLR